MKAMKRYLHLLALLPVIALTPACSGAPGDLLGRPDYEELASELPRRDAGNLSLADLSVLSPGKEAFALELFHQLRDQEGNLFFSPYSISAALAMTSAGARGETAEEMADTLHFPPQTVLGPAMNSLEQYLASLEDAETPEGSGDPFQLRIANALWGQKEFHFESQFLDALAENYGAGLRLVDFIQEPETSRETINEWVSQQTQEKIQDLIPQGAITGDTRLVLSNAIYFKATWLEQFDPSRTEEGVFHGLAGDLQMPFMKTGSDANLPYFQGPGFQAVELPYVGGSVSMLVIVPDQGGYQDFEQSFNLESLDQVLKGLMYTPVSLTFPKFEFESELSLAQILSRMGMPLAVSQAADFSGMTGEKDLFISDVFHKAYLQVDEEGTEAAAATAVIMAATSAPLDPRELVVDRPFLFLIRESQTNTILFLGRLTQP